MGPRNILPLIGFTGIGKEGPEGLDPPLPTTIIEPTVPVALMLPQWGKGDPPTSITGKLPHPLVKSKPKQRSWQISDLEFQNTLQVARAVCPANQTGGQHVIISCMIKHKKQQSCAKTTSPFMIPKGIVKDPAETMQVRIHMPTSHEAVAWQHTKFTWHRFLYLDEKDFTQGRCSHVQTTILAPICHVKMVQYPDQCQMYRWQHSWAYVSLCT